MPGSALCTSRSPANATSELRRRAKRAPSTASSPGRKGGRSRHRRLGGRASDSPAAARQRAGSGRARPRPQGRVPTDAPGRGLRRTRIDEQKVEKRAITLICSPNSWLLAVTAEGVHSSFRCRSRLFLQYSTCGAPQWRLLGYPPTVKAKIGGTCCSISMRYAAAKVSLAVGGLPSPIPAMKSSESWLTRRQVTPQCTLSATSTLQHATF